MTANCLSRLKADPHVQKKWILTNRDGTFGVSYGSATWYGQITLVNKSTAHVIDVRDVYLSFNGKELRPLHVVDIELKDSLATGGSGTRIQMINVHLQSLEREGIERQEQIRLAASLATQASPKLTFLAGDTNFYTSKGMEVPEALGFRDAWKHLRGGEPGHTFGFTYPSNTSTAMSRRIDGIFFWPDPGVIPDSIELFGGDSIQGHPLVFLSDHVGLTATFRLNSALGKLGGNVR
jgi:endonuclease/exonuclease/phosphatase family metal-dependent hydrolase